MNFETQTVLLAEDNEDDVFIFKRAFKQAQATQPLQVVMDGQAAVDYLAGTGEYADRTRFPLPVVAFIDLKLPLRHGLDVLRWIRGRPELRALSVVILTSSAEPRDLVAAREGGARFYIVKPPRPKTIADVMAVLRAEPVAGSGSRPLWVEGDLLTEPRRETRGL
jgi:CheY-like chemotaxis protein